jgi:hypothetical protein
MRLGPTMCSPYCNPFRSLGPRRLVGPGDVEVLADLTRECRHRKEMFDQDRTPAKSGD